MLWSRYIVNLATLSIAAIPPFRITTVKCHRSMMDTRIQSIGYTLSVKAMINPEKPRNRSRYNYDLCGVRERHVAWVSLPNCITVGPTIVLQWRAQEMSCRSKFIPTAACTLHILSWRCWPMSLWHIGVWHGRECGVATYFRSKVIDTSAIAHIHLVR